MLSALKRVNIFSGINIKKQENNKTILFLSLLTALIVAIVPMALISPLLIVLVGTLIGLLIYFKKESEENIFLSSIFSLSFISRIVISLFFYNFVFIHKGTGLIGDGWSYSENGGYILQMWLSGMRDLKEIAIRMIEPSTSGTLGGYDFWNAIVYYFTDKSPLSMVFINCLASSLTIIFIYNITKQLYNEKAARISAILTAFWPSLFIWSTQNLKEPSSNFLIAILIWAILQLKVKFRFHLLFIVILSSLALKELREVSFLMFYIMILPFSLVFSKVLFLWKRHRILLIFLIALIVLAIATLLNTYLAKLLPRNTTNFSLAEYLRHMRTYRAYGNTAFLSDLDITAPGGFVSFLPAALSIAWLAPFPWQLGSMLQVIAMPEMILYYLLLPAMFLGWRFIVRHKISEGGIIIVYIFIMMLVLAFVEGNVGTLFRHRAMVLPFMFVLIGIGLEKINPRITVHD